MTKSQTIRMTYKTGTNVITIVPWWMITKKGATKNKAMPLVDEISRIPVIPLSWRAARCAWHRRCRRWKKRWTWWWVPWEDGYLLRIAPEETETSPTASFSNGYLEDWNDAFWFLLTWRLKSVYVNETLRFILKTEACICKWNDVFHSYWSAAFHH